jgi:hypothetical protein
LINRADASAAKFARRESIRIPPRPLNERKALGPRCGSRIRAAKIYMMATGLSARRNIDHENP